MIPTQDEVCDLADVQPFNGIRYDHDTGGDLSRLLCPPYDVVSPELQRRLHDSCPHNAIRLELGLDSPDDSDDSNRYTRAAALLDEWLDSGVLRHEDRPAFYLLREEFPHRGGRTHRLSLIARVRLEELTAGVILPHEFTSPAPKKDRHALLTATQANLSPIMSVYRDRTGLLADLINCVASRPPLAEACHEDVGITLWNLQDEEETSTVTAALADAPVYLADGHHRYETALLYRGERLSSGAADGASDFVMMSLLEITMPGLIVLPYHRMVRGLSPEQADDLWRRVEESFDVETVNVQGEHAAAALEERLEAADPGRPALGLVTNGGASAYLLTLRDAPGPASSPLERCVTWIAGSKLLSPVLGSEADAVDRGMLSYTHDSAEVARAVTEGGFQLGLVLPATPLDLFEEVVLSGERMPIKSTYFSPKLPTGLVINRLT